MNQGPKRKHLSVISPYRRGREWSTLALSDLSGEQSKLAQSIINATGFKGVLVGAVLGSDEWDLRPMVLSDGAIYIIRRSRPGLSIGGRFGAAVIDTQKAKKLLPPFQLGEAEGRLWVARKFYNSLLTSTASQEDKSAFERQHSLEQCKKLLDLVAELHSLGVIHGHIWNGNIAVEGVTPQLLDTALAPIFAGNSDDTMAPELKRDPAPSSAADIYGLGLVMRGIFEDQEREEHRAILDQMLSSDPISRPSLNEVRVALGIAPKHNPEPIRSAGGTVGKVISSGSMQTPLQQGKLIKPTSTGSLVDPPEPPPSNEREPAFSKEIPRDLVDALRTGVVTPHAEALLSKPYRKKRKPRVIEPIPAASSGGLSSSNPSGAVSGAEVEKARAARPGLLPFLIVVLACVATLGLFRLGYLDRFLFNSGPDVNTEQLKAYWSSRQPSLMREVARAACVSPGSRIAQAIIVKDVLQSGSIEHVKSTLIKVAFDPHWEGELSARDRSVVLRLGLRELVPELEVSLKDIDSFHPAVMLAVMAELKLDFESDSWSMIPTRKLTELPAPYGGAFKMLAEAGLQSAQFLPVRALAHILGGRIDTGTLNAYFSVKNSPEKLLAAIVPALSQEPNSDQIDTLFGFLHGLNNELGTRITWFDQEKGADWSKVISQTKLSIAGDLLYSSDLELEQFADLLAYPSDAVRKQVVPYVRERLPKEYYPVLLLLAGSDHKLTREQTVFLISALSLPGEQGEAAIASWFTLGPDPTTVAALILALNDAELPNTFNIEGARYLLDKRWDAPLEIYAELANHKEPLVRAFAYAGIDAGTIEGFRMLKDFSLVEKDARLASQIVEKLKLAVKTAGNGQ